VACSLENYPHRRRNLLTGEWVLVSPHRAQRPWQGQLESLPVATRPVYDPQCYLCPGNERAGGHRNPHYTETFVFDNDFAALRLDAPAAQETFGDLLEAHAERGLCRVVCFSPRHDLTLAEMDTDAIRRVVEVWTTQHAELGSFPEIRYVQIFENKGEVMGCSNPHPHGQIWAQETIPNEPWKETLQQQAYYNRTGNTLLGDYLALELRLGLRIVCENAHFVALVPYWAIWPFETLVVSRRPVPSLLELTEAERQGLADILKRLLVRYDNLFQVSFPYSAGFHQAPTDGQQHPEWHLHLHVYPPLLRSATIRKFMVGYEMLAMPQRDLTPEAAAAQLRRLSEIHFRTEPSVTA